MSSSPDALSAYVVDCAVYVGGNRLPGRWTHDHAVCEVRGRDEAFVWIGLHEPDEGQINGIAATGGCSGARLTWPPWAPPSTG